VATASPDPREGEPRDPGARWSGRNATKATVRVVEEGGRRLAVKSAEGRGLLARWLLAREAAIFRGLPPSPHVPRVVEASAARIVTEWVEGRDLFEYRKRGFTARRARALEDAVGALHAAGFAHGDLGRHDVVFRPDGTAVLFDFATGIGPGAPPVLWRVLLPLWRWIDRRRVRRLVRRYVAIRAKRCEARRASLSRRRA
jgi:predicted Ser/Thr protein kinase